MAISLREKKDHMTCIPFIGTLLDTCSTRA